MIVGQSKDIEITRQIEKVLETEFTYMNLNDSFFRGWLGQNICTIDENGSVIKLELHFVVLGLIVQYIVQLRHLRILILNDCSLKYEDFSSLSDLKSLKSLGLSGNIDIRLMDFSFLSYLKGLSSLILTECNIQDFSFLLGLKGLISLGLSRNKQLKDFSFLSDLKGLVSLDLTDNDLTDISFLSDMYSLKALYIGSNEKIKDYSCLTKLERLSALDLSKNDLKDVSFLSGLKDMKRLYLDNNRQIKDHSCLSKLKGLWELNLSENDLKDISFLRDINNLKGLYLASNGQVKDHSYISKLKGLMKLDLSFNNLKDVSFLSELKSLTELSLSVNNLKDVSFLSQLKGLIVLNLSGNQLQDVSFLKVLDKLRYLNLRDNPIQTPPFEIAYEGLDAIRAYFRSLKVGAAKKQKEVKVLLVGSGGVGKTSLVKRLLEGKFDKNEPQTHSININSYLFKQGEDKIKANFWDFGGQEIMHATHQFFLSKRSLYILVLDCRKDEKVEYWLKHIGCFGADSPVLIVLNKTDENPAFDVNRPLLQEKFPNIKGFYRTSCAKNTGIKAFARALTKTLAEVGLNQITWPGSWFIIKKRLETMSDHFISHNRYKTMCIEENILDEQSQDTLADFLNDLGVVLHFKNFDLEDTYVLKSEWVTEAVYKIINSEELAKSKGHLNLNLMDKILHRETGLDCFYTKEKYRYIITLMKKFELCYQVDDESILVPDLQTVAEPTFHFDYVTSLKFIFKYDVIPRSVISRFIVNMHKDIKNDLCWRTGVVLVSRHSSIDGSIYEGQGQALPLQTCVGATLAVALIRFPVNRWLTRH